MRRFPELKYKEFSVLTKLNSPRKIQDFLDSLPINFEKNHDTCRSALSALKRGEAHCMEGALIAAAALWMHGEKPLLLDLKTAKPDDDHVVALFREKGRWGAISKTNHAVLRYRDAIFKNVRELALSYFNEYFLDSGVKTLRSFSEPFDLLRYKDDEWLLARHNLWHIADELDTSPHQNILESGGARRLRLADKIEIEVGKVTEWKAKN